MYLSSVWTKWKLDTKCIYLFIFWAGPNLAKTLLDLKHDPACLQTTTLIILKENNLWCIFSASNIGHKLKQSRPPGSITLFLSKVGMVYFTSRLILNEQNKVRDKLGWFLPVLEPDCQRWCWIETKLLPVTHRKKKHTHTQTNVKSLFRLFSFHLALRTWRERGLGWGTGELNEYTIGLKFVH